MDFKAINDRLRAVGAPGMVGVDEPREADPEDKSKKARAGESFVIVDAAKIVDFLFVCREDEQLGFEQLVDLSATDPAKDDENLWIGYQLLSVRNCQRLAIKALVPKDGASLPSATAVYAAARWHEREAAEMFGVTFEGHPDPRNILLPDDWVGHPMRKDYEFPTEYHGISCV